MDFSVEDAASPISGVMIPAAGSVDRKIIWQVELEAETLEFDLFLSNLEQAIRAYDGYLENSSVSGNAITYSSNRYGSLTIRIPSDKLEDFLGQVGQLCTVTHTSKSSEDVTLDYVDVEARIAALDIGSLGELLEPAGTLRFEQAYAMFKEMVLAGAAAGADLIAFETMTDLYELKAAVLAAQENCDLPIFCTMTFDKNNRTFSGVSVAAMACLLNSLDVAAIGVNCSPGPEGILPVIQEMVQYTNLPLIVKANAGLPNPQTGAYDIAPEEFARQMLPFADLGVQMLGGCCGTGPAYIAALKQALAGARRGQRQLVKQSAVCSPTRLVQLNQPLIVGERLNPTGKKVFQQALRDDNIDYILARAIEQQEAGADILDVNVGLPGIDEPAMLARVIKALQGAVDLPLQIDSSNPEAIEAGLRVCNGKAIVNSVNGLSLIHI